MANRTYRRYEIEALADRLAQRAQSRMMSDRPYLQNDLRAAAAILRFMLDKGMPVCSMEVDG